MNVSWDVIVFVAAFLAILVFLPRTGILARFRRARRDAQRILREDALKHVYHCEYSAIPCTLDSLAGSLGLNRNRVASLLEELSSGKLISYSGAEIALTEEGRGYALSIIRVHRLWERYLSDETTVQELQWHEEAERQEHRLSEKETNELAKRLGHPLFDPHGDPIPSPAGVVPEPKGNLLQTFQKGDAVRIIHVEDEPASVYAQLVDAGLFPGTAIKILTSTAERITVEKEGETIELTLNLAANITAQRVPPGQVKREQRTLASLEIGSNGVVTGISPACRGLQRRRLMDLGIVPGTPIQAELRAAGGDPVAYRIRGAMIALRRQQAELVFLEERTQ